MLPILISAGPVTVYSYGVLLAIAFLACAAFLSWYLPRRGVAREEALDLVLAAAIGGLVGSRILYVASNWGDFAAHPLWIFEVWRGGMIFFGGAILGSATVAAYAMWRRLPLGVVADGGAMSLALGSAIGRIGCFLNGCCYGVASDSPVACAFPGTGVRVLPTQLFDSAANLAIFGLLLAVALRGRVRDGVVWWVYVVLYGVSRFSVEMFRVNPRGLLGLSQAQQLSVLAVLAGIAGLTWMATHGGLRESGAEHEDPR